MDDKLVKLAFFCLKQIITNQRLLLQMAIGDCNPETVSRAIINCNDMIYILDTSLGISPQEKKEEV